MTSRGSSGTLQPERDAREQVRTLDGQEGTATGFEQQLVNLPHGAHACIISTTAPEKMRAEVLFLRDGIRLESSVCMWQMRHVGRTW